MTATPPISFAETLLQFLAVVIRGGFVDLGADLFDAAFEVGLLAGAINDRGVVLVDDDSLGAAEILSA